MSTPLLRSAEDIPDLSGQVALVTGANSGLGLVTARELARHGARVLMACRDTAKGEAARRAVLADTGAPAEQVEVRALNLASLESVRGLAAGWQGPLDVLVLNAGVMAPPKRRPTADGFELQWGTNHLGHFALAGLLWPVLVEREGRPLSHARVVTVSSGAHKMGRIDFADLNHERSYRAWQAYGQSKLANLLFALELDRRAAAAGAPVVSAAAHPGYASTNLQLAGPAMDGPAFKKSVIRAANRVMGQSDAQGALPQLAAATLDAVPGGAYVGPGGFMESRGLPVFVHPSAAARDAVDARRLWAESERLTGVRWLSDGAAG
jgi:NAD(P)-dependent dehydrogenase (short-subunit alcohol dehydrogenase family)